MKTFKIMIETGNDAMNSLEDVANAIRGVAEKLDRGQNHGGKIWDSNGNHVGWFHWEAPKKLSPREKSLTGSN